MKCRSQFQRVLRQMKEVLWPSKATVLEEAADRKDFKAFYDGLKRVYVHQEHDGTSNVSSN